jgi:hypothetical protein
MNTLLTSCKQYDIFMAMKMHAFIHPYPTIKAVFLVLTLAAFIPSPVSAQEDTLYLGIYEGGWTGPWNDFPQDFSRTRLMFKREGKDWVGIWPPRRVYGEDPVNYPSHLRWYLPNGKESLEVKLVPTDDPFDDHQNTGVYTIEPPLENPISAALPMDNSHICGWASRFNHMPLVLTTHPMEIDDDDGWEIVDLTQNQDKASDLFRRIKALYDNGLQLRDVTFNEVYRFYDHGTYVVSFTLNNEPEEADGQPISPIWYYISDDRIEKIGIQLTLISRGDFDNDNDVDWLFWFCGYSGDAYVIFSDNFRRSAVRGWKYH